MKAIIIIFFSLIIPLQVFACDCDSTGEFLTAAPNSNLVALVKVNQYLSYVDIYGKQIPLSMEVEIVEMYKGSEIRKMITVWGDDGNLCRPYLNRFGLGQYYIIAFYETANAKENTTDYYISNCGDYWLNVVLNERKAIGSVSKTLNVISFEDIKRRLAVK